MFAAKMTMIILVQVVAPSCKLYYDRSKAESSCVGPTVLDVKLVLQSEVMA
jgi:hypothetical protein